MEYCYTLNENIKYWIKNKKGQTRTVRFTPASFRFLKENIKEGNVIAKKLLDDLDRDTGAKHFLAYDQQITLTRLLKRWKMTDHVSNSTVIMAKVEFAEWLLWRDQVDEYLEYRKNENTLPDELEEELLDMIYHADDTMEELFGELKDW